MLPAEPIQIEQLDGFGFGTGETETDPITGTERPLRRQDETGHPRRPPRRAAPGRQRDTDCRGSRGLPDRGRILDGGDAVWCGERLAYVDVEDHGETSRTCEAL